MKIFTRLTILLLGTVVLFLAVNFIVFKIWVRQTNAIVTLYEVDKVDSFKRIEALASSSVENYARDYSSRREMIQYVQSPSQAWAMQNIASTLPAFHVELAWIYNRNGELIFSHNLTDQNLLKCMPKSISMADWPIENDPPRRFFTLVDNSLVELIAAPIEVPNPSGTANPVEGLFVVGHVWNGDYLRDLEELTQVKLSLVTSPKEKSGIQAVNGPDEVGFEYLHPLRSMDGQIIAYLRIIQENIFVGNIQSFVHLQSVLLTVFSMSILLVLFYLIYRGVVRPIQLISFSMIKNDPAPLIPLHHNRDEIGSLARLVGEFYSQQERLKQEIADRLKAEASLKESQLQLEESFKLRERLAQNLHDGIIQSLYAIGLRMQALQRRSFQDTSAYLVEALEITKLLNAVIGDVRSYIEDIDPPALEGSDLGLAIKQMVASLGNVAEVKIELAVDERVVRRLQKSQTVDLFYCVHELLSNAIRHGKPHHIKISLQNLNELCEVSVEDDGIGLDPDIAMESKGRGLQNLKARVTALAGRLVIDSEPDTFTKISILIPFLSK